MECLIFLMTLHVSQMSTYLSRDGEYRHFKWVLTFQFRIISIMLN